MFLILGWVIFSVFLRSGNTTREFYTDADFIQMIRNNISASNNYVLPLDNSNLMRNFRDESEVHDYGIFDFVIVGAGTAGTLMANRLSEETGWRILLLEAGGPETDFSDIPGMNAYLMFSDMNWGYHAKPQRGACLGMRNNSCVAPRGKVLGGCSTINAKLHVRGNKADFDLWERMGNVGWSYEDILPYFIRYENYQVYNAEAEYHGRNGPLNLAYTEPTILTEKYIKAMGEMGYPWVDYNGRNQIGSSQAVMTIKGNKASTGGRAFIDPIAARSNLNVTLNAFVVKILINNGTKSARGVRFIKDGKLFEARTSKEVILSAGAFNSPQLLMLSGIGPRAELRRHHIDVLEDLPVGRHLQDHPMFIGLVFRTNQTLFNGTLEEMVLRYRNHERPLTDSFNIDSVGFANFDDESSVPDIEHMIMAPPGWGSLIGRIQNLDDRSVSAYYESYNPYTDLVIFTVLLHERSRGSVTLKSKHPRDFPIIDYNYLTDEQGSDIETLYNGIVHTLKLLDTKSFKSVNASVVSVVAGCEQYQQFSKDYWYCAIRHLITTVYHPVGTTRMGTSRQDSVVSSELIVHGMVNLRVVDAGVMPEIPSGNTNAATYMIAEKMAHDIRDYYHRFD